MRMIILHHHRATYMSPAIMRRKSAVWINSKGLTERDTAFLWSVMHATCGPAAVASEMTW